MNALSHHRAMVYPAGEFRVDTGAHIGDPLGRAGEICTGDVYCLARAAQLAELVMTGPEENRRVAPESSVGTTGASVKALATHTLMGERGAMVEVVLLAVGDQSVILPLGALAQRDEYTLMASQDTEGPGQLASVASVSFSRGTRVTLGTGEQCPVEDLSTGDLILTRDHGPQPIRWIGQQTVRAEGNRAPVVITKGAMNNAVDLVLSPDHRLFVYQRRDELGAGRAEVLVRARHLINGTTIFVREGGHVDYFHLLLDRHEILYVEGIQAESLLITPEVLAGFDADLLADLETARVGLEVDPTRGVEPAARELHGPDTAALLKRASSI